MNFTDILLVIISSAGFLHGTTAAMYLSSFKKKKQLTNYILALILVFMAFRIGKSVLLYFGNDLEPVFIFIGLAFLLIIGPLLRWYVLGMTRENFKLTRNYFLELLPFLILFLASFFVTKNWFETKDKQVIIVFASVLIFIYLHFAFYILIGGITIRKTLKKHAKEFRTKSQKAIFTWLNLLIVGFVIIWISYFLNIIEDAVPYITGPIMYSMVIYFLSLKAFQLKVTDLDGSAFKKNDDVIIFNQIQQLIQEEEMYLEPTISLSSVSATIGKTTQKTSEVINQYAKQNFNDFINSFRIEEAKKKLIDEQSKSYTIASIAFDVGFSSLSSFNSAFKKIEGITPSAYRKERLTSS